MNRPQFSHILLPASDPNGKPVLSVIAKSRFTFSPDGRCVPNSEPAKLVPADKFFDAGDPLVNSCEVESDLVPWKTMTDIVVIGKAHAPRARPVIRMGVSVSVGKHRKDIVVSGDRTVSWRTFVGPAFTEAKPFVEMDLRYERAYGGVDIHSTGGEVPMIYARNPIGRGFVIKNKRETLEGLVLPNLEDANMMLTPEGICVGQPHDWHLMPMPAGFGVFGKGWYPRCSFAGVMPADLPVYEQKHEEVCAQLPKEHVEQFKSLKQPMLDFRFFSGGSPGLAVPYIAGNETVMIEGMSPDAPLKFALPGARPNITIDYGDGAKITEVVLQTVVLDTEQKSVDLTWRGATEYPGLQELDKITKLDVTVEAA